MFTLALSFSWANRNWVLQLWAAPWSDYYGVYGPLKYPYPVEGVFAFTFKLMLTTALLATLPIFSAEAWLLLCRWTRRERARWLTLPFCMASTGGVVLALWLAAHTWRYVAPQYSIAF